VVGYTQRFRRKWLAGKEKVRSGALGDVTLVTSRAFMNRLVAIDNYKRTDDPKSISPMVISGTHALDMCMWYLEKKTPVECYARSIDKVLGPLYQGIDATAGMIMMSDNSVYHLNISWALPVTVARRGLFARGRHRRHRRRADHRRHPPRHGAGR
jgi:predicted dehydrogenase